jgi:hypothetical protein
MEHSDVEGFDFTKPIQYKAIDNPLFDIQIDALTMLAIIANIDLALKYQPNIGPTAILGKNAARQMASYLHKHTPLLFPELIKEYQKSGILPQNIDDTWQPS